MKYLLDTDVILELASKAADRNVLAFIDGIEPENIFLSAISIGELCRCAESLPETSKKTRLLDWLHNDLMLRFGSRILAIDADLMITWGRLTAGLEREGREFSAVHSLLLSLAVHNHCILVSRNTESFQGTGIKTINPWKGA
jgi:predicted nucleic acid-binding protein